MKKSFSHRDSVKKSAINAVGLSVVSNVPLFGQVPSAKDTKATVYQNESGKLTFIPVRAASWWVDIEEQTDRSNGIK